MINCSCKRPTCKGKIWPEVSDKCILLWFVNDLSIKELSIYLDPNGVVDLIQELKAALNQLINQKGV